VRADAPSLTRRGEALRSGGFTLLELLIAITLLGLLTVIVGGAFRVSLRSAARAEKAIDSLERLRTSLMILDAQIQSGVPLKVGRKEQPTNFFKGDEQSVQFVTTYSIWAGHRAYVYVVYRIGANELGKAALFATEYWVPGGNGTEIRLLDNWDSIRLEYLGWDNARKKTVVGDTWTDGKNLPQSIRFRFKQGGQEYDFIIPVRVRGNA